MSHREVSLNDVAKKAGVSPSTVSRVLNRSELAIPVSQKTRDKVEAAATELGYMPSAAARALRKGKTRTIGALGNSPHAFMVWNQDHHFADEIMHGLLGETIKQGYHLSLLTGMDNRPDGDAMVDLGLVDGILILNRDLQYSQNLVRQLRASGKPAVYLFDFPDDEESLACAPNNIQGGQLAVQEFVKAGHTRIGYLDNHGFPGIFKWRKQGWQAGMAEAGLDVKDTWHFQQEDCDLGLFKEAGITALVCANSSALNYARKHIAAPLGLAIPDDLSLIHFGHDGQERGERGLQANSVAQSLKDITAFGVRKLVAHIEGKGDEFPKHLDLFDLHYVDGPTIARLRH